MMEALGLVALVAMGVVLGSIGAGGSILILPILVYLFSVAPSLATAYSLLIVGTTALFGAIEYVRRGQSDPRMAVVFGGPTIAAVYLTRRVLFPAIPDPVVSAGGLVLAKDTGVMVLLAALMLVASISMLRAGGDDGEDTRRRARLNVPLLTAIGFTVGVFTGLVGAGGGFMILPVLVLLGGLPMRMAVGTCLLIIAAKSLLGFVGDIQAGVAIDYRFVGRVALLPLVGMLLGTYVNRRTPAATLRKAFGWFVLVMGCYIVVREVLVG